MSKYQEIASFIWRVCDDELRGLFKAHEYGDIILPFVTLRRLDCLMEPHKDKVVGLFNELKGQIDDPSPIIMKKTGLNFFNSSQYDLNRLKSDPRGLKVNFPNYLGGYSSNVIDILKNFELNKKAEKLQSANRLYALIDKFTEIDLHPDVVDNHLMGSIYEELLRRFSEMSNETSGEHYTPRDVVQLLVAMVFAGEEKNLQGEGIIRSIFDPCCGTGGMLTVAKDWVAEHISEEVKFQLYGQELQPVTHAICKSDFLITGEDPDRIRQGSSLSNDRFEGRKYDYMITNPPFGVSWKSDKKEVMEEVDVHGGRFTAGVPRVSDGSLLFLQHMISKMNPGGSRIGLIFNGSPLFTGDAGSGESNIRKWIIENDWLECIVALPDQLFFNTGISTYIWIVSNKKSKERQGKVQLIDATEMYKPMKKSLGDKRKEVDAAQGLEIVNSYNSFKESEISKIYDNEFFGYTKVTIEQPKKDDDGKPVVNKRGERKADSKLRDYERVPLSEDIEAYYNREVEPHLPDSWVEWDKNKVGYEINFTKYFYKYKPLRSVGDISKDLLKLEEESKGLLSDILA